MMSHYRVRSNEIDNIDKLICFSKSLAGWTFVFNDYYEMDLTRHLNDPYLDELAEMVDPYGKTFQRNSLIVK